MSAFAKTFTAKVSSGIAWRRLAWDSEQFGFAAARLDIAGPGGNLVEVIDECRSAGIRHLTARVDAANLETIHALEQAGFELLDGIQTFELDLASVPMTDDNPYVRLFRAADLDQVLAIARSAFVHDRFHSDAALPPGVADRVNEAWLDNCCRGAMADAVFVAEEASSILGFVTCKVGKLDQERRTGTIGMVATQRAARRQGVARDISASALQWFRDQGASTVQVGTQLANIAAARLYVSLGFLPVSVALTFRRML